MKILLAIDGSKFSEAAMQAVIAQAHSKDTEVRVLHVVEPPSLLVAREMGGYDPALETVWEGETKTGASFGGEGRGNAALARLQRNHRSPTG